MSQLHTSDREALRRAGFTEREINTQQRKFYNLTQINLCYTDELRQFHQLMEDRRALLEALKQCRSSIKGGQKVAPYDSRGAGYEQTFGTAFVEYLDAAIAKATGEKK